MGVDCRNLSMYMDVEVNSVEIQDIFFKSTQINTVSFQGA